MGLLIEVSLTTLDQDRGKKLSAYARAGIPFYSIVNLVNSQVVVYSDPGPAGYGSLEVLATGHVLSVVIDRIEVGRIAIEDILP